MDCEWNFQTNGVYEFGHTDCEGLYQQFLPHISPGTTSSPIINWRLLIKPDPSFCWHYLRYAAQAINTLHAYLNDSSNFIGPDGEIDLARQLQAHGSIYLIFADLNAVSFSSNSYNSICYAMSALDKLSNLIKNLTPTSLSETEIFKRLVSEAAQKRVSDILSKSSEIHGQNFSKGLRELCLSVYRVFHRDLRIEALNSETEHDRLNRFRAQRNLRHGAFLNGDSFFDIFGHSRGDVPPVLPQVILHITLALAANPKDFFSSDLFIK